MLVKAIALASVSYFGLNAWFMGDIPMHKPETNVVTQVSDNKNGPWSDAR